MLTLFSRYGHGRRQICGSTILLRRDKELYEDQIDEPVKLSMTKAYDYKSYDTFTPAVNRRPPLEIISICLSFIVLLVYFIFLREENSIDKKLDRSLYDSFPEMEIIHLKTAIEIAQKDGKDTSLFVKRLNEIEQQ